MTCNAFQLCLSLNSRDQNACKIQAKCGHFDQSKERTRLRFETENPEINQVFPVPALAFGKAATDFHGKLLKCGSIFHKDIPGTHENSVQMDKNRSKAELLFGVILMEVWLQRWSKTVHFRRFQ